MKETLGKTKLMALIKEKNPEYHNYEIEDIVNSFLIVMKEQLSEGNRIMFESFFSVHVERPKRKIIFARESKELYLSPAHPKLRFTVSRNLVDMFYKNYTGKFYKDKNEETN